MMSLLRSGGVPEAATAMEAGEYRLAGCMAQWAAAAASGLWIPTQGLWAARWAAWPLWTLELPVVGGRYFISCIEEAESLPLPPPPPPDDA